jgi:hypothetical protein
MNYPREKSIKTIGIAVPTSVYDTVAQLAIANHDSLGNWIKRLIYRELATLDVLSNKSNNDLQTSDDIKN